MECFFSASSFIFKNNTVGPGVGMDNKVVSFCVVFQVFGVHKARWIEFTGIADIIA